MLKQQLQFPLYHQTIHEALPDPDLAQHFLDRFPTPRALHNITAEEEEELTEYDQQAFKPLLAAVNLGTMAVRSPHDLYGQAASSTSVGTALIDEFAGEEQEWWWQCVPMSTIKSSPPSGSSLAGPVSVPLILIRCSASPLKPGRTG